MTDTREFVKKYIPSWDVDYEVGKKIITEVTEISKPVIKKAFDTVSNTAEETVEDIRDFIGL